MSKIFRLPLHPVALLSCALLTMSSVTSRSADRLAVGGKIPSFSSQDQHGQSFEFKPGYAHLLITFDMGTAKAANKVLTEKGTNYLSELKAAYISDIYGMPAIGRFFALPKMKKYNHRIILADAENLLDPFPRQEERVTILDLDDQGAIEKIAYWNPRDQDLSDYLKDPQ